MQAISQGDYQTLGSLIYLTFCKLVEKPKLKVVLEVVRHISQKLIKKLFLRLHKNWLIVLHCFCPKIKGEAWHSNRAFKLFFFNVNLNPKKNLLFLICISICFIKCFFLIWFIFFIANGIDFSMWVPFIWFYFFIMIKIKIIF